MTLHICVVALCLILAGAVEAQNSDPAAIYRDAVTRQQAGDLEGAKAAYLRVLASAPTNFQALSNLGATLAGLHQYEEAVINYRAAISIAPPQFQAQLRRNLALAYYKGGHPAEALAEFESVQKSALNDLNIALLVGECYLQLGKPDAAVSSLRPFSESAAQEKAFAWVYGMALLKMGDLPASQRALEPILRDAASAESQYAQGMLQVSTGDLPAAIPFLLRAEQLNPLLGRISGELGEALLETGDPDAALAAFYRQLKADPKDFEANMHAASILNHREKFNLAEPLLRTATTLRPDSLNAQFALSTSLIGLRKFVEARACLEKVVAGSPEFGEAHKRLSSIYGKLGLSRQQIREAVLAKKYGDAAAPPAFGLLPGSRAPVLRLNSTSLPNPSAGRPAVLVFGSYTCPNYRFAAPALNELFSQYGKQLDFRLVYIREAHSTANWQSTINTRNDVALTPATSSAQKHEYAAMCVRKLHIAFPAAVDDMENSAERKYQAWPSRVYVVDSAGVVRYSSGLSEIEFNRAELQAAMQAVRSPE